MWLERVLAVLLAKRVSRLDELATTEHERSSAEHGSKQEAQQRSRDLVHAGGSADTTLAVNGIAINRLTRNRVDAELLSLSLIHI